MPRKLLCALATGAVLAYAASGARPAQADLPAPGASVTGGVESQSVQVDAWAQDCDATGVVCGPLTGRVFSGYGGASMGISCFFSLCAGQAGGSALFGDENGAGPFRIEGSVTIGILAEYVPGDHATLQGLNLGFTSLFFLPVPYLQAFRMRVASDGSFEITYDQYVGPLLRLGRASTLRPGGPGTIWGTNETGPGFTIG